MNKYLVILVVFLGTFFSCNEGENVSTVNFRILDNKQAGIDFINQLEYDRDFNVYKYRNYYNGGGVALGDVNNDGLVDIYFTSNLGKNKLYLNQGDQTFEDVSITAGVEGTRSWSTGVTMVDINADGFLDIYVCNSGDIQGDNKENELFINQGNGTFIEQAADYGLNDSGFSTHASFFDYDKDGDLDVYLLNNSYKAIGSFNLRINERPNRDATGGDKLLRNESGVFQDVSEEAGIYGSVIGFGLGIAVGDVNNDMWEDIYVSNDFFERDYLYINQKDGTFEEVLPSQMKTISGASMGADMADIDNNGYPDIFVTEMLPSDPERLKSVTTFEDWNKYQYNLTNGYHHQFTRNTLQYNNGDGTFSELGRYAGVEASDWSWGALFFDMDNDGLKDLFIANGIYQDLTNQDYLQYIANEQVISSIINDDGVNYKELIDIIPSNPIPNHFYKNESELKFKRIHTPELDLPTFSNGSAYGDLDNDGDYDLVINNVNMPPSIFINEMVKNESNGFVRIVLKGTDNNTFGIGSKVLITTEDGAIQEYQYQPARGFQSSMDPVLVCGVGNSKIVDIEVIWPDLSRSRLKSQVVNSTVVVDQEKNSGSIEKSENQSQQLFKAIELLDYSHVENAYSDFNRERLIYHMKSNLSPKIAVGDLDQNGINDFIVAGSKGSSDSIFYGNEKGYTNGVALEHSYSDEWETSDLLVFDANGDDLLDIYVASGGVDISPFSPYLYDQLFLNDGKGGFAVSDQKLPNESSNISSSVVISNDYDKDGDLDLFIGERAKIGRYGAPCGGFILENDGSGNFKDITADIAPSLLEIGMINDALFVDLDGDSNEELILVGEFMPITILKWTNGEWNILEKDGLSDKGWFNCVGHADLNGDGREDLIVGNHGLNSRFQTSLEKPIQMYFGDFDQNGFPEGILTYRGENDKDYPFALRHNLIDQLKYLKGRFPDYQSYKNSSIDQIFTESELENVQVLSTNNFQTKILLNTPEGFISVSLPKEVQYTPIYSIATEDFDRDGDIDVLLGGNQYNVLPEAGIYDASYGVYLENDGSADFTYIAPKDSGLRIDGQVRDMYAKDGILLVARNNDSILSFKY